MLHTIYPLEVVLDYEGDVEPNLKELTFGQMTLVVERLESGEHRLVRLISPNPQDYLIGWLQPGSIVISDFRRQI